MKYFYFIALGFFILGVMSMPKDAVDNIRNSALNSLSPFLKKTGESGEKKEESRLALENRLLQDQLNGVYEWLTFDERIQEEADRIKEYNRENRDDIYWKDFFQRRSEELKKILEVQIQSLPARVVFRDPAFWSSSVWINVGEKDNEELGRLIVGRNSPVVVGSSLVGVVEFVGYNQSRVRLITDAGLVPSVRAVRGDRQNDHFESILKTFFDVVKSRDDLFSSGEEKERFLSSISTIKNRITKKEKSLYLAKGELRGSSYPLWRSCGRVLRGTGFNYEFADEEGPSRDLGNGVLQKGDLLVTSGLDGVFPRGLDVAIVVKVDDLKEGSYSYNLEAVPTAMNLDDLSVVFVMPPLGID